MPTDKLSTGQPAAAGGQREPEAVSALGLYSYGARLYSFLSPEPLSAVPGHCLSREVGYTYR